MRKKAWKYLAGLAISALIQLPSLKAQPGTAFPAQAGPDPQAIRAAHGTAFLTRIRLADPDYHVILIACLKENELNLLLSRTFPPEQIPILVKGLIGQLSQSLPGEDLRVVAFRPIVPLHEAGIASLNAETGAITYQSLASER